MRIRAAIVTAALVFWGPAFAANEPQISPTPPAAQPETPPPAQPEEPPKSVAVQLDELFETLKTEKDADAARRAETSI